MTATSDPAAVLTELLETRWASLHAWLLRRVGSSDDAADLAQEAFVRLWRARGSWADAAEARPRLYRIARNLVVDRARRHAVRTRHAELAERSPASGPPPPDRVTAARELEARIDGALAALPERRREIFELVRFEGLSYREAAEALDVSDQTVANQVSLAVRDLATLLAPHADVARRVAERRVGADRAVADEEVRDDG